jgi:hypothetical protein
MDSEDEPIYVVVDSQPPLESVPATIEPAIEQLTELKEDPEKIVLSNMFSFEIERAKEVPEDQFKALDDAQHKRKVRKRGQKRMLRTVEDHFQSIGAPVLYAHASSSNQYKELRMQVSFDDQEGGGRRQRLHVGGEKLPTLPTVDQVKASNPPLKGIRLPAKLHDVFVPDPENPVIRPAENIIVIDHSRENKDEILDLVKRTYPNLTEIYKLDQKKTNLSLIELY